MSVPNQLSMVDMLDILNVHESAVMDTKAKLKRDEADVTSLRSAICTRIKHGETTGDPLTDFLTIGYEHTHRAGNRARYERIQEALSGRVGELAACVYSEEQLMMHVMTPNPHSQSRYQIITHTLVGVIAKESLIFDLRSELATCTLPLDRYAYTNDLVPHVHARAVQEMRSPFSMVQRFLRAGDPFPDDFTREDQYIRVHIGNDAVRALLGTRFDPIANALHEAKIRFALE